ncbi:MAG: type VI secretion system contractile sheath small subunit [Desulfobacterales bacterium]|jgi:type VI secretion system protein ImpB|nr:type VI secretion system contractile sheath small subunit [Desulfobacterales bacterium]
MARESTQHKLDRVRSPRVHITYDVEIGDAIEMKEIPFVVGVIGDYSGKPEEPLPKLMDRKFVEIDRDNFDNVLSGMKPRLTFQVDNKITDDNTQMGVELNFRSLEDFHPERVAEQIEPLRKLVEARSRLSDLVTKLDGNDKLEALLQEAISSTDGIAALGKAAGVDKTKDGKTDE